MKKALLIVSVLGICIAQMSSATETTLQSNNTSTSDTYKSHVDEISKAIDNLSALQNRKNISKNELN